MDLLHGYELEMPFQNKDAGFSKWTFGKKRGQSYFIKQLFNPIYPVDDSLPPDMKNAQIASCKAFEQRQMRLNSAINEVSNNNLTPIVDFFRKNSHYYLVMPKIVANVDTEKDLFRMLDKQQKSILLKTISSSMMRMHSQHIVHADMKASNVMLSLSMKGFPVAKIIDYGNSFFESEPPKNADDLGGDQIYLSPEGCRFMFGEDAPLTCKLDIYSMGLMFHEFLTGRLPEYDEREYDYPYEAVLEGEPLRVSSEIEAPYRDLIASMLECDPEKRCDIYDVCYALGIPESEVVRWGGKPKKEPAPQVEEPKNHEHSNVGSSNENSNLSNELFHSEREKPNREERRSPTSEEVNHWDGKKALVFRRSTT